MNEKWTWLPDFASDMGIWEDDLVGIAPDADHAFVAYENMVSVLDNIYELPEMAGASSLVVWGLGAVVLWINATSRSEQQNWIMRSTWIDQ